MALLAHLKELDSVDEAIRELYKEDPDGGFKLDVEDVLYDDGRSYGNTNYGGLKKALGSERAAASEAQKALKQFEGVNLEELNAAADFQSKYKGKTDDDFESKLAEMQGTFEEKLRLNSEKMNEALSAKDNAMKGSIVERVIAKHKDKIMGSEVLEGILREHLTERMALGEDGGHYITDDAGNARQSGRSDSLGNMDVEEYFGNMQSNKEKWGAFFKPNDNSGSGGTDIKPTNSGRMTKDEYNAAGPDARQTFYKANAQFCDSNGYND